MNALESRAVGLVRLRRAVGASLWIVMAWLTVSAQAASLTASLDRDTFALGESATLSLTFTDGTPPGAPGIPAPPRVTIQYSQQSQKFSMFNGQTTSSLTYEYQVTASSPGDYTIAPIQAQVGGQVLATEPLRFKVLKANAGAAGMDGTQKLAFLKLIVPKTSVYVGETFPVEIQLYLGVNYDNVEMPQMQGDGFVLGKIPQPTGSRTQVGNRLYVVFPFKLSAVAVKSGTLSLGPAQCSVVLQVPVNRRGRDVFEDFFGPRVQRTPLTLASEPQSMTVLPIPTQNRPANFNGAVGSFTITASASPTNLAAGDPITLRLQVTGRGNLEALPFPADSEWSEFKLYPPTSKLETADPLGISGVKSFERVVIPQNAEVKQVPSMRFSFFDPEGRTYRTLATPSIPISVRPGDGGQPQPTVLAGSKQAEEAAPPGGHELVHNKPFLGTMMPLQPPLVLRGWFLALQGIPIAAWLAALGWRMRQDRLQNNPRLRRRLMVAEGGKRGVKELASLVAAQENDRFFALVFRLLQEQLGERLDLPASAITEAVLDEKLRGRAPDDLVNHLHELFQLCNQARYAAQKSPRELMDLVPAVDSALDRLRSLPDVGKT